MVITISPATEQTAITDSDGVNVAASLERLDDLTAEALELAYPHAEVVFDALNGIDSSRVEGGAADDEQNVWDIMQTVYNDGEWLVTA